MSKWFEREREACAIDTKERHVQLVREREACSIGAREAYPNGAGATGRHVQLVRERGMCN